jgi:hypothetical protein
MDPNVNATHSEVIHLTISTGFSKHSSRRLPEGPDDDQVDYIITGPPC